MTPFALDCIVYAASILVACGGVTLIVDGVCEWVFGGDHVR